MIVLALTLIALGTADLIRWKRDECSWSRAAVASCVATSAAAVVASLAAPSLGQAVGATAVAGAVAAVWTFLGVTPKKDGDGKNRAWLQLMWFAVSFTAAFALTAAFDPVGGRFASWYADLPFDFAAVGSADAALLVIGGALFLLATSNRLVGLVLVVAGGQSAAAGDDQGAAAGDDRGTAKGVDKDAFPGGRLIGSMERIVVTALIVAGQPTGVALVFAAKSLIRLPSLLPDGRGRQDEDRPALYLLAGTFASLILAGTIGILISATS